ncbi:MAG: class I SAM-dependent methyltransferase [Alphaproteobacteria bacterium]|nr:MAG: class I SAM-dependent methyltransferase [Alphaproteobacteria bacterium]
MSQKRVLNVGGNNRAIPLPPHFASYEHLLLDIDPKGKPDILSDARDLSKLESAQFDAVYCSHNLEHYYRHDVPKVLAGFQHVLHADGFAQVIVPDLHAVMHQTIQRGLDVEDVLYQSHSGPIMVLDVLYGYSRQIESSGEDFYAHKTGFTQKSLVRALLAAGFERVYAGVGNLEVNALAFKSKPTSELRALFGLPDG